MESRSLSAICELVRSKKEWSKYVDDIWQDAFKGICELPYVKEVERDVFCVANTEDFLVILHTVTLDVGSFPKCTCNWFKSSKIPCPGICTVLSRRTGLFNKTNLHPRWRLENHPLYQDALRKLNLTVEPRENIENTIGASFTEMKNQLDLSSYNSIVFPKKRDLRYSKLHQQFLKISELCISNEHFFKHLIMNLNTFEQWIHGVKSNPAFIHPQATPISIPIQPPRKRGRTTTADDTNKSALKRSNKCGTCFKAGRIVTGHVSNSKNCPEFGEK